jgi:hypothetical protein
MTCDEFLASVNWAQVAKDVRASIRDCESRRSVIAADAERRALNARERIEYDAAERDEDTARWFLLALAQFLNER